jgi:hypothetical protein
MGGELSSNFSQILKKQEKRYAYTHLPEIILPAFKSKTRNVDKNSQ